LTVDAQSKSYTDRHKGIIIPILLYLILTLSCRFDQA